MTEQATRPASNGQDSFPEIAKPRMTWEVADERTTPIGLVRYGFEYIGAAILVEKHDSEKRPHNAIAPVPAYFLAAHGIELTLKAYLRFRGVSARDLTLKIGHDLHLCNDEAKRLGLGEHFKEHGQDTAALELLVTLNGPSHSLRYFQSGMKTFPLWSLVEPLAVRLHQAVAPLVGYHTFEEMTYSAYA